MNAVATTAPAALNYADLERLAASIAQSGLFGIKTKDQAIALMMIAHAEGRHLGACCARLRRDPGKAC